MANAGMIEHESLDADGATMAISAMMTTTMMGMKEAMEMITDENPKVANMLGRTPFTKDVIELFGADGCVDSAGNTVREAIKMISRPREVQGAWGKESLSRKGMERPDVTTLSS